MNRENASIEPGLEVENKKIKNFSIIDGQIFSKINF